jgi:hypothetical protein
MTDTVSDRDGFLGMFNARYSDYATFRGSPEYDDICFSTAETLLGLVQAEDIATNQTSDELYEYLGDDIIAIGYIEGISGGHAFVVIPWGRQVLVVQSLGALYVSHTREFETTEFIELMSTFDQRDSAFALFGYWHADDNWLVKFDIAHRKPMHISLLPDLTKQAVVLDTMRLIYVADRAGDYEVDETSEDGIYITHYGDYLSRVPDALDVIAAMTPLKL